MGLKSIYCCIIKKIRNSNKKAPGLIVYRINLKYLMTKKKNKSFYQRRNNSSDDLENLRLMINKNKKNFPANQVN